MTANRMTVNPRPKNMVGSIHREPTSDQWAITDVMQPRPDREQERNRAKLDTGVVFIVLV